MRECVRFFFFQNSPSRILIKNGNVVNADETTKSDVYVEDGIIKCVYFFNFFFFYLYFTTFHNRTRKQRFLFPGATAQVNCITLTAGHIFTIDLRASCQSNVNDCKLRLPGPKLSYYSFTQVVQIYTRQIGSSVLRNIRISVTISGDAYESNLNVKKPLPVCTTRN